VTRHRLLALLAALAAAYLAFGVWILSARAPRPDPPPGEIHGAYHVHTTKSDGRGSLDQVVRAARQAGLQFVVVTDHNVMTATDAGYRDGVLVIQGSEVSAPYGHVVGLGIPRELTREERQKDTIGNIRALGGQAVIAHPFHPKRPFTRWANRDWSGFEVVSNDSFWGETLKERGIGRILLAALALPWDGARSVMAFYHEPKAELARYDALASSEWHPLLCANDAHGYPSYRSAFEAFSMHVPVTLTGDAAVDVPRVLEGLLGRGAYCVFDGVWPAWGVRLSLPPERDRVELRVDDRSDPRARYTLYLDGAPLGPPARAGGVLSWRCDGTCAPGAYRVEGRWDGRPWLFTNPVNLP
jgi:hypothetical protein